MFPHVSPQHLSIVGGCEFAHHNVHDHMMRKTFDMKPASHFDACFAGNAYGFRELTLADMFRDPIVQDLMRSDRLSATDIRKVFSGRGGQKVVLAA